MSLIQSYIDGLSDCLEELRRQDVAEIVDIIFDAYKKGKQIFIMGNGGSAATASHFANDLLLRTAREDKPLARATSLTDNVAVITALANDIDYSSVFVRQLAGRLDEGDVIIVLSASGNSPNVVRAVEFARSKGAVTIGFTGFGGGKVKKLADKCIVLSSHDYGQVEDTHLCLAHIISYALREKVDNA